MSKIVELMQPYLNGQTYDMVETDWDGALLRACMVGARLVLIEAEKRKCHYVPTHAGPEVLSSEECVTMRDIRTIFADKDKAKT